MARTTARRTVARAGVLVALALIAPHLAACSTVAADDALGGPGLPVQLPGESYTGDAIDVDARLVVGDEGCFRLSAQGRDRFVIWPAGFRMEGDVVITRDGEQLESGDPVTGPATLMPVDDLFAIEGPDGYWAATAGFCLTGEDAIVVLDDVEPAS